MPAWSSPKFTKLFGTLILSLGVLGLSHPAHAGFEWVAPAEAPAPSSGAAIQDQAPAPMAMPTPQVYAPVPMAPVAASNYAPSSGPTAQPESISPVVIDGSVHTSGPSVPVPSAAPSTVISSSPDSSLMPAPPAPMASSGPATATISTSGPGFASGEAVRGFANNVPLSVALREILPPGYGFSLDPDVDMGTLVSFRGGKSWRETLRDMLEPAGLGMHERGQMIVVGHGNSDIMPMPSSASVVAPSSGAMPSHGVIMGSPPHNLDAPPVNVATLPAASTPVMPAATNVPSSGPVGAVTETWNAERGDSLHKVIEQWSRRANVEFNWLAEYDYPLQASVSFTGSFEDAVRNILTGFETAHPQPIAELHANPNVNQMVLVVTTRGNNYSD